jgi:hypothetical protein
MGIAKAFFDMFPALATWRKPDPDEAIIRNFLKAMSTQDNRCTAFPIYYVIRSSEYVITEEGYGDDRVTYVNKDSYEHTLTQEEWEKLPEYEDEAVEDENGDKLSQEDFKPFYEKKIWREHRMFLTETDAEWHLKAQSHHYSSDAHTYVKCAADAPELREFLLALFHRFGIEPREDKGTM